MKNKIINFVKIAVSVLLIYFLVKKIGIGDLYLTIKNIKLGYLFLAFVFTVFSFLIQVQRLKGLTHYQKIKIGFSKLLEFSLISNFFGIFLPTVVGGDVVKMAYLGKYSGKNVISAGVILMDRIVGTYALVFVAFIASLTGRKYLNHQITIYTLDTFLVAFCILVLLNFIPLWNFIWKLTDKIKLRLVKVIKKFVLTIQSYKLNDKSFIVGFLWSLLFYLTIIISNYFVSLALGLDIRFTIFFVFVPLLSLAGMLPISISGLGVRESVSVVFFATLGISANYGVMLSFLPFVFKTIIGFFGGLIYLKNEIIINK